MLNSFSFDDSSSVDEYESGTDFGEDCCLPYSSDHYVGSEQIKLESLCNFSEADIQEYIGIDIKQEEPSECSDSTTDSTYLSEPSTQKKRKQGMHGNQVRSPLMNLQTRLQGSLT